MSDVARKHKRVPALLNVIWEGVAGKHEARTSDITVAGCFIDTLGHVRVGETIKFKLCLPAGNAIELQGEVVHKYPNVGFGVRFTNISEPDRKRLEWLVKAEEYKVDKLQGE
ncbi:MAG TPA: PilZ domain-containing protein [Pyrinomonadaceae bacterium]|jgi:hypothetical protein|nr:PilZ domain-containing protein [Pyrinomonadaceae bacterium]